VVEEQPVLDETLVGATFAMRWTVTGWAAAVVKRFYPRPKTKSGYNYECRYIVGGEVRDQRLQLRDYSTADGGPAGTWCILRKRCADN
jgi:hypothetical protein